MILLAILIIAGVAGLCYAALLMVGVLVRGTFLAGGAVVRAAQQPRQAFDPRFVDAATPKASQARYEAAGARIRCNGHMHATGAFDRKGRPAWFELRKGHQCLNCGEVGK